VIAAAAVFLSLFAIRASFAATGPSVGGAAELDAIVRQLAASQKNAIESCDSSSVPAAMKR